MLPTIVTSVTLTAPMSTSPNNELVMFLSSTTNIFLRNIYITANSPTKVAFSDATEALSDHKGSIKTQKLIFYPYLARRSIIIINDNTSLPKENKLSSNYSFSLNTTAVKYRQVYWNKNITPSLRWKGDSVAIVLKIHGNSTTNVTVNWQAALPKPILGRSYEETYELSRPLKEALPPGVMVLQTVTLQVKEANCDYEPIISLKSLLKLGLTADVPTSNNTSQFNNTNRVISPQASGWIATYKLKHGSPAMFECGVSFGSSFLIFIAFLTIMVITAVYRKKRTKSVQSIRQHQSLVK